MSPCLAGQAWSWDGVRFRVLNPRSARPSRRDNDRSCVLLVEGGGGRLLLAGDISDRIEPGVAAAVDPGPAPVLLVPHHGSSSSSSSGFIAALRPRLAIVSAGWRNRFGHPRPDVLQRYAAAGVPVLNTATAGAVEVDFPAAAPPYVAARWRYREARYWRE
jgi:competence protein ComEC